MRSLVLALVVCGVAHADAPARILGKWHVVGCETSPRDPAPCMHGEIAFEATRWSIDLPCCKAAHAYKVVSSTADKLTIDSDGTVTEIRFDTDGKVQWTPGGLGGRVRGLTLAR